MLNHIHHPRNAKKSRTPPPPLRMWLLLQPRLSALNPQHTLQSIPRPITNLASAITFFLFFLSIFIIQKIQDLLLLTHFIFSHLHLPS